MVKAIGAVLAVGVAFVSGMMFGRTDTTPCVQAIESAREVFAAQAEFTRATGDFVGSLAPMLEAAWDRDVRGLERAQGDLAEFRDVVARTREVVASSEFEQLADQCVT